MLLGIKGGLLGNPFADLAAARPDFCELWFHSGKIDEYKALFEYLKQQNIRAGIHFWGMTQDGILANFAYPDAEILYKSREMAFQTLEAAAKHKALYVNFHPTGSCLTRVSFEKEYFDPYTSPVPLKTALPILTESFTLLASRAKSYGIPICIESVPLNALGHPWRGMIGRHKPVFIGEFSMLDVKSLLSIDNVYFANDFGHSAGTIKTTDRQAVFNRLKDISEKFLEETKLLHVGYIVPPYNGTDYHGCLYYDELKTPVAVPNETELINLLKLYSTRKDVYALVEPETDHVRNFQVLKTLVAASYK